MNSELVAKVVSLQSFDRALSEMSNAQLIRRAKEEENAYWFKHALVQDTAYTSLLRHDRKRLHALVAETLERMYPERVDELAPRLAEHFDEAGDTQRALYYFQRAAENAAARYANREALLFYTKALDAAEEVHSDMRDSLYRARGVVYERTGNFDEACADLETALRIARQTGDALAEWQSLMDLGFAWTARDYARAGEYFQNALTLARASGSDARIAHTLNRVGNWHVNNDEPQRAASYHAEALQMFETLHDTRGVAETRDLLSMAGWLGADYTGAQNHADAASALFEQLGDKLALVNMQVVGALRFSLLQGDTVVLSPGRHAEQAPDAQVLESLRQLGWRPGEAFGLMVLGEGLAVNGAYERALEFERASIALAREINHRQWLTGATMLFGEILARLLNFERAQPLLEDALKWARELGSMHWTRTGSGFLASTLIAQGETNRAADLLRQTWTPDMPAQSVGQRQVWTAYAELELARGDAVGALKILDTLTGDAVQARQAQVIPRLWLLRAQAQAKQNQLDAAIANVRQAREVAQNTGQPEWAWRSGALLAQLYRAQGRAADGEQAAHAAREVVTHLARPLQDETVREIFVRRALRKMQA